ncbi:MAG: 50S ribosomal protein L1 [Gammaproteobacteria bacterium]
MAKIGKRLQALKDTTGAAEALQNLDEAVAAVVGGSGVKFDETIDVAVRLGIDPKKSDQAVRGAVVLPAGTGKTVRVAVVADEAGAQAALDAGADKAGLEDLIEEIKGGKTDFDVLIATPAAMRLLAPIGKILGPRGLMPNPKTGTVNADTAIAVKNAKAGQVRYRADKGGIVHAPVGKASFAPADLKRNIESLLDSIKRAKPASSKGVYLRQLSLSATMGVAVAVDIATYR